MDGSCGRQERSAVREPTFRRINSREEEIMVSALAHVMAGGGGGTGIKREREEQAADHHHHNYLSESVSPGFSPYGDVSLVGSQSFLHG